MINFSILGQLKWYNLIDMMLNVVDNQVPAYYVRTYNEHYSPYDTGHKYCGGCAKFFKVEGKKCPVCSRFLRTKPKGNAKTKYNKRHGLYDKAYRMTDGPILLQ